MRATDEAMNGRQLANLCALGLIATAAGLAIVGADEPLRFAAVLLAFLLVPGWAVVSRLATDDPLTALALTVAFSLAIDTAAGLILVWTGWWEPGLLAGMIACASAAAMAAEMSTRHRSRIDQPAVRAARSRTQARGRTPARARPRTGAQRRSAMAGAVLTTAIALGGLGLWALSLEAIDPLHLGPYGLTFDLPLEWVAGLLVLVLGAGVAATRPRPSAPAVAAIVVAIAVFLYATIPALVEYPHYSWTYKHIGVTRLLVEAGQVDAGLDIYNRWPGFFALAAAFSVVAGATNPIDYAQWAELLFMPLAALMLGVAVQAVVGDRRVVALTVVFFVASAWVAQMYFAPQSVAFLLSVSVLALCLRHLPGGNPRLARRIGAALARLTGVAQQPFASPHGGAWPPRVAGAAILLLYAALVPTHQLTPFIVLASVIGLYLFGFLGSRWLVAAMTGLVLAYLAFNFDYVRENFTIFTGLNPVENAQSSPYDLAPASGKEFSTVFARLLPVFSWLGAALALARLAWVGLGVQALPLAVLAAAPFVILFTQSYGGEAVLRVILFSTPWCVALIAWALTTIKRQLAMRAISGGVAVLFTVMFIPAYFGTAQLVVMPPEEVEASGYLYEHGRDGAVVMLAAPNFPTRFSPTYPKFVGPQSDTEPNLLRTDQFRDRPLGPADVAEVRQLMHDYSRIGYLVFSRTQYQFARLFGLTPPGELRNLEDAVAASPQFEPFYANRRTRIYSLRRAQETPSVRSRSLGDASRR